MTLKCSSVAAKHDFEERACEYLAEKNYSGKMSQMFAKFYLFIFQAEVMRKSLLNNIVWICRGTV